MRSDQTSRNPRAEMIRVLLVEDNPGDVRFIQELLAEARNDWFDLVQVDRLAAGLERLMAGGIDAVLLDLDLPDSKELGTFGAMYGQAPETPIMVLSSLDDEAVAIQAVQKGAQDYLVKGQVSGDLLSRAIRYAMERHRLQTELEQARQREQRERERAEAVRSYTHYLAMSHGEEPVDLAFSTHLDDATLYELSPDYRDIVLRYVRAVRLPEDRPSESVREFARRLAAVQTRARDVVRLHLIVLNEFSQRALPIENRAFSNDARLVLVELMGHLMDIYLGIKLKTSHEI